MSLPSQSPQPFRVVCEYCSVEYIFNVDPEGFYRWRNQGVYIQAALPDNTADERELLRTRICGPCFNAACPPDGEDDTY
jgi:hypothetical protein